SGDFDLKGAPKTAYTYVSGALVGSDDGTGALTCDVDDASGWLVGDKLVFATTAAYNSTPKVDKITIATITAIGGGVYGGTGAATVTWTDGAG
ncbi:hypothetical protein, partial [Streptococcus pneumoniae]|uniref:hypothetical protein n=1 Tax=Streptococcus pneumoniae TaxID=1313 RepID=UPI001E5D38C0